MSVFKKQIAETVESNDGQEMTIQAVIKPEIKTEPVTETATKTPGVGKLTWQDCINAGKSGQRFYKIRTTERGVEILDRRPLTERLTNPLKNVLATFGDGHYLISAERYQQLVN